MYANILLPLSLAEHYLYEIPDALVGSAAVGMRCLVQFGPKRFYVGIIASLQEDSLGIDKEKIKSILSLPDDHPIVSPEELISWQWTANYYLATIGDVLCAALPLTLIPESETSVYLHYDRLDDLELSEEEALLIERIPLIKGNKLNFDALLSYIGKGCKLRSFDTLLDKGFFSIEEEINRVQKKIGARFLALSNDYCTEEALLQLENTLRKQPARLRLFHRFLELQAEDEEGIEAFVSEEKLISGDAARKNVLRLMLRSGIFREIYLQKKTPQYRNKRPLEEVSPLSRVQPTLFIAPDYSEELLFIGRQIRATIAQGKRVLLLLPQSNGLEGDAEILRQQLHLADEPIYLYTSNLSNRERAALRYRMFESDQPMLIVGSRTASFIPSNHLGLIIVAEEQDPFYKQQEPAPRYNARDLLIFRASQLGIPILLTSVTPSLESLYNVQQGKYVLIDNSRKMPVAPLSCIDMEYERSTKRLKYGSLLSLPLREELTKTLARGEKVIVLSSRRGFAPVMYCKRCNNSIRCSYCDVSLTYHSQTNRLVCHYCGYTIVPPTQCPKCNDLGNLAASETLEVRGFGTERIEDELRALFPHKSIVRIDADTLRGKGRKERMRQNLADGVGDIFVGTQQLVHFAPLEGIRLIAVTQLDQMLAIANFRTDEQIFNLLYQLAVKYPQAHLWVQTNDPKRPILTVFHEEEKEHCASTIPQRYSSFLMKERQLTLFPPYIRLINVIVKSVKESDVIEVAQSIFSRLSPISDCFSYVSAPITPYVSRIRLQYIRYIALRVAPQSSSKSVRYTLKKTLEEVRKELLSARRSRIIFDVDPQG